MESNVVSLELDEGFSVKIHLFGATVISWINSGEELLFLSGLSKMDGSKAVRGGIPVVFPNFGPWSCGPQHGFARISWWKLESKEKTTDGGIRAKFILRENEETLAMWNHKFCLEYTIELRPNMLQCSLNIINSGTDSFDFTTLLHTYFRVSDISDCSVTGFQGCTFVDKVSGKSGETETREDVKINENVDRVYSAAGKHGHTIKTPGRNMEVQKSNLDDTVLWNPWETKAREMSDFDNDGYLHMICVEAGHVSSKKCLKPGESFECGQKMTVVKN